MNKTLNINLGGFFFHIDEEKIQGAYPMMDRFIQTRNHGQFTPGHFNGVLEVGCFGFR